MLCPFVSKVITASVVTGSSTKSISNQLEAGSIIVRHITSNSVSSLPLRVYGLIRSTHNISQGFVMTSCVGRCPYLCLCHFVSMTSKTVFWHAIGWFVLYLSNTSLRVTSLQDVCIQDAADSGNTNWLLLAEEHWGWQFCHLYIRRVYPLQIEWNTVWLAEFLQDCIVLLGLCNFLL